MTRRERRRVLDRRRACAALLGAALALGCAAGAAADQAAPAAARHSAIQVRLVGTAQTTSGSAVCVLEALGGQGQYMYRVGDAVLDEARIIRIEWQRVVLMRDGEEEVLELAPGPGAELVSAAESNAATLPMSRLPADHLQLAGENQFIVARGEFEQVLQVAMAQLPQQLHAEPYIENGRTIGYRVSAVRPDGLFAQIGLRDGDVVRRINSADFSDPLGGGRFPDIRSVPELTVEIMRGATTQVLRYRFR